MTLLIGFVLLILALYKVIGQWKSLGMEQSGLMNVMIKDQIIYYFMYGLLSFLMAPDLTRV